MTEDIQPIRPTYEQIRDGVPHAGAKADWQEADRLVRYANEDMQRIHEDAELSEEGKRLRAQRVIDRHADKIKQAYTDARRKVEADAENSWQFSVPMPDGGSLATTKVSDPQELLAIQAEANTLAEGLRNTEVQAATRAVSKHPGDRGIQEQGNRTLDELRSEFDQAMAQGGVEGKIRALAVKRVADSHGISMDDVADHHRTERHRRYYSDAQRLEAARHSIPSGNGVAQNPYEGKRGYKSIGTYRGGQSKAMLGAKQNPFQNKRRKPSWK